MFGKTSEVARVDHKGHSILQDGMTIRGDLDAAGDVRLDGRLEGKIKVSERLTVGEGGTVAAEVEAGEVIIMGTIHGNVTAHRRIEIRKGAVVIGDITTPVLVIEEGVRFNGRSNMTEEAGSKSILHLPETGGREASQAKEGLAKADA